MKKLSGIWTKVLAAGSVVASNVAYSAGKSDASEIFDPINEKTNNLVDQLVLWGSAVCVLCIVAVGLLAMFGKFPKQWAVNVAVGATIILLGANIANFLLN